ncbi:hypothetical protein [Colwellia echini]|uniref:Beta-lactamase-inhibitor-like PepSY-like domain-containing protein n=1 Tax=Colwellia echini TaxID=1982103 RepID=A0ABY3N0P5_9GAMM|nr:hypothetical protein [Colwellia echini]TYK67015.1 hypothetical protein CWS31_000280 [Colwellia echini]
MNKNIITVLLGLLLSTSTLVNAGDNKIGASLNQKQELALVEIPASAMATILENHPDFIAQEAEMELKHGKTYLDIEGIGQTGKEIEFDMLLKDGTWQIVEIQRDLVILQCPEMVLNVLPDISPQRIIESDQTNGIVIYEFYTVDENNKEGKYEVKVENNQAVLLTKEWTH